MRNQLDELIKQIKKRLLNKHSLISSSINSTVKIFQGILKISLLI